MDLGIAGRVAIVTGAASRGGVGRAIALALAREGADVAAVDISLAGAEAAAGEIEGLGRRSLALQVDQGDCEAVAAAVARITEKLGPVDILVNNAAIYSNIALLHKMEVSAWEREVRVNLSGPYYWTRAVLPGMVERGWGRIINISSVAGRMGGFAMAGYASTKAGLGGLAKTAALEGGRYGITANTLYLGIIETETVRHTFRPDIWERMMKRNALQRAGRVEEVASTVVFLASEGAGFLTGADIVLDGGQSLFVF